MRMLPVFVLLLACPALLRADPAHGFGVTLGGVTASQGGVTSSGLSLGGDAQFVFDRAWSLNPFLMVSLERASATRQIVSDALGGLQLRRWVGEYYVGPQLFFHDRLLVGGGTVSSSQYGPGVGLVAGWEGAGGFSAGAQVDALEGQFLNPGDRRNALRVYVGYRWH